MPTRAEIVAAARAYLKVPYQHQGRTHHGIDCLGIVTKVAHNTGLSDVDYIVYPKDPDDAYMEEMLGKHLQLIAFEQALPGDIVFLRDTPDATKKERHRHLAIITKMLPNPYILHASGARQKVVEHRMDSRWRAKVYKTYRYPGVTD